MTEATPTPAKPKPVKRRFVLVRYGRMNNLGVFEHNEPQVPRLPTRVVVKTDKGLELGHLVGQLYSHKDGRFRLTEEQICSYYINSEINFNTEPVGKVVRFATPDDISEEQHLQKITEEEIASCEQMAKELNLRMKIIDAEHIFGGERIIFYFMAEGRVDFRELVRKLAQEYQTRIEMRQIGSRDEAKLLGDIESCGRECCCLQFLQLLKPVNMRMAKMQKATLDPSKISGFCGRLKCCLRYEDETYTHLKQTLPRKGILVQTKQGEGKVFDTQILTQLVIVEYENGERAVYPLDEVTVLPASAARRRPPEEAPAQPQPSDRTDDRDNRPDRPNQDQRNNRTERNNRGDRNNRSDRNHRGERSGRDTRGDRNGPGNREEQAHRNNQPRRDDRVGRDNQAAREDQASQQGQADPGAQASPSEPTNPSEQASRGDQAPRDAPGNRDDQKEL